jgi:AraC-like DNA-binding protein
MTTVDSPARDAFVADRERVRTNGMVGSKRKRRRSRDESRRRFEEAANLYLQDCFAGLKPVSVKEFAARHLSATRPYLSRIAPQFVGATIRDYFRSRQLARAEHLLRTMPPKVTLLHISLASGFGSPWTFSVHFKEAYGMTPGKYRKHVEQVRPRK